MRKKTSPNQTIGRKRSIVSSSKSSVINSSSNLQRVLEDGRKKGKKKKEFEPGRVLTFIRSKPPTEPEVIEPMLKKLSKVRAKEN